MVLSPEKRQYRDALSGRIVTQWTGSSARDNHLYFTSHSVTADDRWLVFLSEELNQDDHPHPLATPSGRSVVFSSDRDGMANVYEVDLPQAGESMP